MRTVYSVEDQVTAKGWKLLAYLETPTRGTITLCDTGGYHPFVTHIFSKEDGGFYHGNYYQVESNARADFLRRCQIVSA